MPNPDPSSQFSHADAQGRLRMVDVGDKPVTVRRAAASGRVRVAPQLAEAIAANSLAKGDLLTAARLAGIQAAKRTSELIPLCHNIPLEHIHVEAWLDGNTVRLHAEVRGSGKTGVEMEALTAVAVAALTVIDMGKAIDPAMVIEELRVVEKTGGRPTSSAVEAQLASEGPVASGDAITPPPRCVAEQDAGAGAAG